MRTPIVLEPLNISSLTIRVGDDAICPMSLKAYNADGLVIDTYCPKSAYAAAVIAYSLLQGKEPLMIYGRKEKKPDEKRKKIRQSAPFLVAQIAADITEEILFSESNKTVLLRIEDSKGDLVANLPLPYSTFEFYLKSEERRAVFGSLPGDSVFPSQQDAG